ncbi:uncharacterized protein BO97DRAFT_477960 [Aspergillus homomorphus CBS 101889]|uniref:AA1-like domain-containing protein n=1 Tax=Aspergillus homomorphus (strain CBS 101889) TaxID=1450537 RepID=A0A395HXE2_ASPHC|nr:hypothetical protein BO97DRAFT_477960 [Aspergillus homomorphus CBS 101889]RAL12196.1 hypothetical protein BO97DRAFT_477960 [Aspergillus homomorphus CBS 101889]
MHLPLSVTLTATTVLCLLSSTFALPSSTYSKIDTRDILRPRNWDLRLFGPGCDPNTTSFDVSVWHRQGVSATAGCTTLDASLNATNVDTFSWKSPGASQYDLCLYSSGCAAEGGEGVGSTQVIRNGWEVCAKYSGWRGYRVVAHGEDC